MRPVFFLSAMVVAMGCASTASARRSEPLYLAIQVTEDGKTVAAPKLLGFEGRSVTAEKRAPGSNEAEYKLVIKPKEVGTGYSVALDLELPSGKRVGGHVGLLHGEERSISLDPKTELKLMLMRVDSAEFKALMELNPKLSHESI